MPDEYKYVVARRANGSGYLISNKDPETTREDELFVIHYVPTTRTAWRPRLLGSYLARGYWLTPEPSDMDMDVVIEGWRDEQTQNRTPRVRPAADGADGVR